MAQHSTWVFTCDPGRTVATVPLSTNQHGACAQGQGGWTQIHWVDDAVETHQIEGLIGADFDVVLWGFGAAVFLWAVGVGVGLLVNIARKAR